VPFCQLVITATIVVITVSTVIAIFTIVSIHHPSYTFVVVLRHWSRRTPTRIWKHTCQMWGSNPPCPWLLVQAEWFSTTHTTSSASRPWHDVLWGHHRASSVQWMSHWVAVARVLIV
jgi:hypothetical protein